MFDHLQRYEGIVNASRAKRAIKPHDPLALVVNAYASSSSSRSPTTYYVTRPPFVVDYDDDYQGDATVLQLQCQRSLCKRFMEQMLLAKKDEAGVILSNEHNDFLLMDASEIEELDDLSANICMMAIILQVDKNSKDEPSYDSTFTSEVQNTSASFMYLLYLQSDHEQTHHEQQEIIKPTFRNDQINSDIIFDDPNIEVNDGHVEHDKNAHDQQDNTMELLARNAYKEAEKQLILAKKVNQQNGELTKELEKYKENVQDFQNQNGNKTNFHNEYIKDDKRAKKLEIQFQNQFIQDRYKIRALEKEKDDLQTSVSNEIKQSLQLKNECTALKHKFIK
uniref:Uncharacterized protein n=1 Tax=Tanacetum cinerariifolium TaxID=118510 RepID=A0A6L2JJW4_TANCI|nr:hypothetical protein [Tanacetum cinerariifolium]